MTQFNRLPLKCRVAPASIPSIYIYKVLNFIEILRFLGRCHWHSLKDRRMKFSGPPRYLLKTKTAKFQYSN